MASSMTTTGLKFSKRTPRLELRVMTSRDFAAWLEYKTSDEISFGQKPKAATLKEFKAALKREKRQAQNDTRWELKIFERRSKKMIGFIDIKTIVREPYQVCDVGYLLVPAARGCGYASEATHAFAGLVRPTHLRYDA